MSSLDDPAPCLVVGSLLDCLLLFATRSDVGCEEELVDEIPDLAIVVALVETESLRRSGGRLGPLDRDVLEGFTHQLEVVPIRSGDDDGQGDAVGFGE